MIDALAHQKWCLVLSAQCINAALTVWGTLGLALVAAHWAPTPALRKWLLCTPLVKLAFDFARGVPEGSYVLSEFAGTRWDLGRFMLGIRWPAFEGTPALGFRLGARQDGLWFGLSGGDVIVHALVHRGFGYVVLGLLAVACAGAVFLVVRRVRGLLRFRRFAASVGSGGMRLGRAVVRRHAAADAGAFTSGSLHPTIWLPRAPGLSASQLGAVLRHELAHVRAWDVALFTAVGFVTDILWFVPGMAFVERGVRTAAERAADDWAVRHGADPLGLATALLAVAEAQGPSIPSVHRPGPAASGGGDGVAARVRALLAPPGRRKGDLRLVVAALPSLLVALSALCSCFFAYR